MWDAWELDPCLGFCGGEAASPKRFRNKTTKKIIKIYCCTDSKDISPCLFQTEEGEKNIPLFEKNKEGWEEIIKN